MGPNPSLDRDPFILRTIADVAFAGSIVSIRAKTRCDMVRYELVQYRY